MSSTAAASKGKEKYCSAEKSVASADAPPENGPPNLVNMSPVVWEEMLSFVPPAGISFASHRISKTLGAGEDKADSHERAAKLALENMMERAWKQAKLTYDGVAANDDYVDSSCSIKQFVAIEQFEDESLLRTYYLASVMVQAGERMKNEVKFAGSVFFKRSDEHCPLFIVMWLLFGRPALPPLSGVGNAIAETIAVSLIKCIGPDHDDDDGWVDTEEQRLETRKTLQKFSRRRILIVAERLGKIGEYPAPSLLCTMLAFGRPHLLKNKHIMQAEYPIDSRVELSGLNKKVLNGKRGIVEKEYSCKNRRIGVALIDEVTGNRRVVGVKPDNLDLLEEDTNIVIDAKIMMAEILFRCIQTAKHFTPHWMPAVVHMLRGVVVTLREKVEKSENDFLIGEEGPDDCSHYSSDTERLFYAECYLGFLLATVARHVAMEEVPREFGGLTCNHYDQVLALASLDDFDDEEELKGAQSVAITQYYLQEAAGASMRSETHNLKLQLLEEKEEGAHAMMLLKSLVDGEIHEVAGFLSGGLGCAFIPLNRRLTESLGTGEHAERTAREHVAVAVAGMRSELEGLFDAYAKIGSEAHPIKVDTICSNHVSHYKTYYLVQYAFSVAKIYNEMWDGVALFPDGECEDKTIFIKLALLVSVRALGQNHLMTKSIGVIYDRISGDTGWADQLCPFEDIEAALNEWLKSYVPLYFGTSRKHPALFHQLTAGP